MSTSANVRTGPIGAHDWLVTVSLVGLFVIAVISAFAFGSNLLGIAVGVIGLVALAAWHARRFGYRCPACGTEFRVGVVADLLAASWVRDRRAVKRVTCPRCGHRAFMSLRRAERQG